VDFYYGSVSGNSSRVAFAFYELGIHFIPHRVDTRVGHNRAPAYLAINPMGKIPALIDGAVRLWESNAINWYLAEKYPAARLLPATLEGRASTQRWLLFQTGHVTPACASLFRATNPRMQQFWNVRGDQASADAGRKELARYLPVLEEALADREWLERQFSLADIAYAPHLWLVAEGGFDFSAYPAVRAWLDRTLARPAWREARHLIFEAQV
jgi:glutathione S-transferase